MQIHDVTTNPSFSVPLRRAAIPAVLKKPLPDDTIDISETAQNRIDQLQQGNDVLQQAVTQSRQAARKAAHDRVSAAKEYLKILSRMSPPGDRGAAAEAARMAREIKSAAAEFRSGIATGEETGASTGSEIAGFAGVAGDALKIAQGLIAGYLHKRKTKQNGDSALEKEVSSAISTVREMVNRAMASS